MNTYNTHLHLLRHLKAVEYNIIMKDYRFHADIEAYNTNTGFFSFDDCDRIKLFEELCNEPGISKYRVNKSVSSSNYGFIMTKNSCPSIYNVNVIVLQKINFNQIRRLKNTYHVKNNDDITRIFSVNLEDTNYIMNRDPGSNVMNILITPILFNDLNNILGVKNVYINRTIFFNSDELLGLKNQTINSSFTWIESRFYRFKSPLLKTIFNNIICIKGFFPAIAVDYYNNPYKEESITEISFSIPSNTRCISREKFYQILYNITYISKEREVSIKNKLENYKNDTCCICLRDFSKELNLGVTPCCFNSICSHCSNEMNRKCISKCFTCKKTIDYDDDIFYVGLKTDKNIKLKDILDDYSPDKKYTVVTSESEKIQKEKNVIVINDYKKIKHLQHLIKGSDYVVFLTEINDYDKEKICYFIKNKDIKIYEV